MSTSCSFCRHSNPDGAKFCNECGAQVSLKPCPECEAVNAAAARQCHQCGHAFDEGAVAATEVSTTCANDAVSLCGDDAHVPETLAYALGAQRPAPTTYAGQPNVAVEGNTKDASPYPTTIGEDPARYWQTEGEDPPRNDRTDDVVPDEADDAVPLHEDIRAFRDSLRQQQARRSYRAAGAALVVVALVATGYVYWSGPGGDGASRTESVMKERSNTAASPEKAASTTAATSASSSREAPAAEPATSSSETAAGQASRDAPTASSTATAAGQASRNAPAGASRPPETAPTTPSVTASSKRGNSGTNPRVRASAGALNDSSADAAATQRLIARDLGRFQSSDRPPQSTLDRDAMETQRLVDRDLAPFRQRNSRPPDRAFPEIN